MRARDLVGSERGAIAIFFGITLVLLFGIAALAVDASLLFEKRNRLAAASDGAALMTAIEVHRNPGVSNGSLQAFANHVVTTHGFSPGTATSVTVNHPPSSGPFAGDADYVEVYVSENTSTFFTNVWGVSSATPGARAVAGTSASTACWITFQNTNFENNDALNAANCEVAVGANLNIDNNSSITSATTGVTGTCSGGGCGNVSNLRLNVPPPRDPLAHLPAPANPGGTCSSPVDVSGNMTINPGKYCGFRFSGKGNVLTLNPGIYYITGPIDTRNAGSDVIITGSGVMIYLAPGSSIDLNSNFVDLTLSAPTSGTYKGIVFYQDRANAAPAMLAKNNSNITLNGALYFPNADVTMKNNGVTGNPCGLVVARSVTIKNNATVNMNNTCTDFGGSPIQTLSLAE